jgi:EAL domain-containing protein (putative c-di-GMP-specific phosphodiesterase class I)
LEETEDAFTVNVEDAVKIMNKIKSLGVKLAIDDFGSGTASFVALHQFPVDVLKVDRSLVKKIEKCTGEAALLHGLVVMARNLNIKLVAEGIETIDQLKAVQELGCDLLQGYYFAKPMPDDQLRDFLASNHSILRMALGAMSFAGGWTERMRYMVPAAP